MINGSKWSKKPAALLALSLVLAAGAGIVTVKQLAFGTTCDTYAPPPPAPPPRVFTPPPPQQQPLPGIMVQTDVTDIPQDHEILTDRENDTGVLQTGIEQLPDEQFPNLSTANQNAEGIFCKYTVDSKVNKTSPIAVDFGNGEMIMAVSHPSKNAFAKIAFGTISLEAPGAVMVKGDGDLLRIYNLDSKGTKLQIQLNQGPFAGPADPTVTVAAGHELVVSKEKLKRSQVRPADGIARRRVSVTMGGYAALSEYSLESVLNTSALIAIMAHSSDGQEKRLLGDLSKMASVLNYVNGTQGYRTEPTSTAQKSVTGMVREAAAAAANAAKNSASASSPAEAATDGGDGDASIKVQKRTSQSE